MSEPQNTEPPELDDQLRATARKNLVIYTLARVGLFIALTAVIQGLAFVMHSPVPLIMSATLALIVAFPLSMLVFTNLRTKVTASAAAWDAQRKARKEWIQRELADR